MRHLIILFLLFFSVSLPAANKQIIAAIGDIHGDIMVLRAALKKAGVINDKDQWTGGTMIVVQTGDILDRGNDEKAILDLVALLKKQAEKAGGRFYTLNGNHELMNAKGDLRYVTEKGLRDFTDKSGATRQKAFAPGGSYATILAENKVALIIGKYVFVHGGIQQKHAAAGIESLNAQVQTWLRGTKPDLSKTAEEMVWLRDYSEEPDEAACKELAATHKLMKTAIMIVGHSVQKHINNACSGAVWRIDTGMSKSYGAGPVEVLMIEGDTISVRK